MILILNTDGSLAYPFQPEYINQHSNNVNYIDFAFSNYDRDNYVTDCVFELLDGTQVVTTGVLSSFEFNGVYYSGYRVYLSNAVTLYGGTLRCVIRSFEKSGRALYAYPLQLSINSTISTLEAPDITNEQYQSLLTKFLDYLEKFDEHVIRKYESLETAKADIPNMTQGAYVLINKNTSFELYRLESKANKKFTLVPIGVEDIKQQIKEIEDKLTKRIDLLNSLIPTDITYEDGLTLKRDGGAKVKFKTINNESIIGDGNINIQGGGQGTANVKANEALTTNAPDQLTTLKVDNKEYVTHTTDSYDDYHGVIETYADNVAEDGTCMIDVYEGNYLIANDKTGKPLFYNIETQKLPITIYGALEDYQLIRYNGVYYHLIKVEGFDNYYGAYTGWTNSENKFEYTILVFNDLSRELKLHAKHYTTDTKTISMFGKYSILVPQSSKLDAIHLYRHTIKITMNDVNFIWIAPFTSLDNNPVNSLTDLKRLLGDTFEISCTGYHNSLGIVACTHEKAIYTNGNTFTWAGITKMTFEDKVEII